MEFSKLEEELHEQERAIQEEEAAYAQYISELDSMAQQIEQQNKGLQQRLKEVEDSVRLTVLRQKHDEFVQKQSQYNEIK